ncbi:ribose-5-phosphate isomerase RpiA [Hymenobacter sp. BRD128]|uniref:ribose-5-phosphate isomerase RpiA n=1 Tax=Hymenobacter sp. BRD128 TaxID=2675878 RepID=UPI001566BEB1|nr:ribose-5-phosphate isomerase RpiA [Hymenobacter sp. BRD128]QKG58374.1 ribose-5-phosphate isomerase RpiA [Hymenobacter sp. BRD128]
MPASITPTLSPQELEKQQAAAAAVRWVRDGMVLGLGSGSTSAQFIIQLGAAVQNGLKVQGTATSLASEALARQVGIPLLEPRRGLRFDLTVDGADELDAHLRLVKGGGGALLREKTIETASDYLLVVADSSKLVPQLGRFPLPLEVVPFTLPWVLDALDGLGAHPVVRPALADPSQPYYTDQRNLIVDCHFGAIADPEALAARLQVIPGVVEHGIFLGLAKAAIVIQHGQPMVLKPGEAARPATEFAALP